MIDVEKYVAVILLISLPGLLGGWGFSHSTQSRARLEPSILHL